MGEVSLGQTQEPSREVFEVNVAMFADSEINSEV